MAFSSVIDSLLPALFLIAAGYALARLMGLSTAPLSTLLRYLIFPAYLFMTLKTRMSIETFSYVALIGVAIVWVGYLIHRNAHRVFKAQVDASVAIPNIACFAIPLFALSMGGRGIGTACSLYVGVSIASYITGKIQIMKLLREPWLYAVIAGMVFKETLAPIQLLDDILTPLTNATYPLLLIFLGVSIYPVKAISDLNAWVTAVLRVLVGFLVALLGTKILPVSQAVAAAVVLASISPPSTRYLSIAGSGEDADISQGSINVGLLVSLIVFIFFLVTDWKPW
jgi:predicted permease